MTVGAVGFGWETPQDFSAAQLRRIDLIAQHDICLLIADFRPDNARGIAVEG
jgi:hypothetical protein